MSHPAMSLPAILIACLTLAIPLVAPTACAADAVSLELLTTKSAYPPGARPVVVLRLVNAGTRPATICSGWGRRMPAEFTRPDHSQLAAPDVDRAVDLLRFGPAPVPAADGVGPRPDEPMEIEQLTIPPGGRVQWLVPLPPAFALQRAGTLEIPWALPPLVAVQGGVTTPLAQRGRLAVTVLTPAACLAAAGVTAAASAVADSDVDVDQLHLILRTRAGRLPVVVNLDRDCLHTVQDATGARHQSRFMPGGSAANVAFGGQYLTADLDLPLIDPDLLTGIALPARLHLGWQWRQWFPDAAPTALAADVAHEETGAVYGDQTRQVVDASSMLRRDDAGVYPEAGHWLAADIEVTLSCDAAGRMSGTPTVLLNPPAAAGPSTGH